MDNELKEAFEIAFCFDITKFEEAYEYTNMGHLFETVEEPRRLKWALDRLNKKFGWKKPFVFTSMAIVGLQLMLKNTVKKLNLKML